MAIKATVYKASLQIADMDRGLYADHALTLARQPSETDERLMARLLAFALQVPADDHHGALQPARGMTDADEPDLWQKSLAGELLHWIEVGQPDERRLIKACGRARRVTLYVRTEGPDQRETAFRFAREGNVRVFYWIDRKFGYALSSADLEREELLRLANEVYRQLNP